MNEIEKIARRLVRKCVSEVDGNFWFDRTKAAAIIKEVLAAATNRAEDLQAHYDRDTAKLQQEIARLTAANGGNYWRWQGDGGDCLESLTCPILIDVGQLHEIFSVNREAVVRADDAEAKLAQSTNYVADHDTYPTCVWFANGRVVSVNAAGVLEIRFGKQLEMCDER